MKLINFILISLILNSCSEPESTKEKKAINLDEKNMLITCYLVTLSREIEIYKIKDSLVYSFGRERKIKNEMYHKLQNPPKGILTKNVQLGCGTCADGVYFKFILQYNNKKVIWKIDAGYDIPSEYKEYFDILIELYDENVK